MVFQKGNKLAKGRAVGSKNSKTIEWESIGAYIKAGGSEKYLKELSKLKGKEYMERYEKILEYFKPKLGRTEHTGKGGGDFVIQLSAYGKRPELEQNNNTVQIHTAKLPDTPA